MTTTTDFAEYKEISFGEDGESIRIDGMNYEIHPNVYNLLAAFYDVLAYQSERLSEVYPDGPLQ